MKDGGVVSTTSPTTIPTTLDSILPKFSPETSRQHHSRELALNTETTQSSIDTEFFKTRMSESECSIGINQNSSPFNSAKKSDKVEKGINFSSATSDRYVHFLGTSVGIEESGLSSKNSGSLIQVTAGDENPRNDAKSTNPFLPLSKTSLEVRGTGNGELGTRRRSLQPKACPAAIKPLKLRNHSTGASELYDTLHGKQYLSEAMVSF